VDSFWSYIAITGHKLFCPSILLRVSLSKDLKLSVNLISIGNENRVIPRAIGL